MPQNSAQILAFYVENFKAIRKGTWFELNKLNILTGANSSGKSTLFNAMKIFTEGFVDGDFPLFDLKKVLLENGDVKNLKNFHASKENIKVGFRYYSETYASKFDVIYTFGVPYFDNNRNGKLEFISLYIYRKKELLLQIFSSPHYTVEGVDTDLVNKYGFEYYPIIPDNPGEFIFNIRLNVLTRLLPKKSDFNYKPVLDHLYLEFGENWCGEILMEEVYASRKHYVRLSDHFLFDMYKDFYYNFFNRTNKEPIFENDLNVENLYSIKKEELNYGSFIFASFKELFDDVSQHLRFFYNKRLFHLDLVSNIQKRIIDTNLLNFRITNLPKESLRLIHKGQYNDGFIFRLQNIEGMHMYTWLKIFDLPGYFVTKEIDNGYHQVIYIDKEENEINIADLGKGHAKLIQLMLAIGYKIFLLADEDRGKETNSEIRRPQIVIHIEEPEAYLHPKWQSLLADFFMKLTQEHNVQFLIETHSVYLIQKLQLLVARKEIEPNEVSLLYFEQAKKDVSFRKINIRKDGLLKESFGEGFYDESAHLLVSLLEHENQN